MGYNRIKQLLTDPVREELIKEEKISFEKIINKFPLLKGEPAFDPELIKVNIKKLKTIPEIDTGIPCLDKAIKIGLAHIDVTFQGDHPKYGVKSYAQNRHDGFPPTIISAVDALTLWGINDRAKQIFKYYILNFIKEDGTINYYGPSISEYGQLLNISYLLLERAGEENWWKDCFPKLNKLAFYLYGLWEEAQKEDGLIEGGPEADEIELYNRTGKYFHNNAWASNGFLKWAEVCEKTGYISETLILNFKTAGEKLKKDTLNSIKDIWPSDKKDYRLSSQIEPLKKTKYITETVEGSYTNYRYWLELLSSGILPENLANKVVEARLNFGGQFCGMTRFSNHLDDWPLTDYLYGLWNLGRKNDFLISLYGHIFYHQAEEHLTAYEQVSFPPGKELAPYCLPCQLVAARAGRLLNKKQDAK
ncbi:MAG TPA: hypothetical protein PLF90_07360 [bacterium]|nr:hypothetical protein [bacterium]